LLHHVVVVILLITAIAVNLFVIRILYARKQSAYWRCLLKLTDSFLRLSQQKISLHRVFSSERLQRIWECYFSCRRLGEHRVGSGVVDGL